MPAGIETITLIGPYAEGEIPEPTSFYFFNDHRDLTGFGLSVDLYRDGELVTELGTAVWVTQTESLAAYEWGDGDCHVPEGLDYIWYDLYLWADDTVDQRYRTHRARFMVKAV